MKKLYMYIIIIFLVMIIPINVNGAMVEKTPSRAFINTAMNYQKDSTISEDYFGWQKTFIIETINDSWKGSTDYIVMQQFNYDFSDRDEEYFSFQIRPIESTTQGILKVNGVVCENVNIALGNQNVSFNRYPWTYQCKNPKAETYIQWEIPNTQLIVGTQLRIYVPKTIGFYNNEQEQLLIDQIQQQQQQNQIINNTDSSGNANDFNNTINNASLPNNSHGFDILGSLQTFISGIEVSGSCNRILVPIPFTNQILTLPCMTTDVYSVHFPEIVVIWQLIVRGIGYYYILVNILKLIKETIDPFNFKLEVMDL